MLARLSARQRIAAGAVFVVLLVAVVALAWRSLQPPAARASRYVEVANGAYELAKPDSLADFALARHDDAPFGNDALKGRWTFLIFGYTFCPDFCPTTLVMFGEMHRILAQQAGAVRDVQFVMVSVDPERDTTQLLKAYVPQFNPEFIGATGSPGAIARLAESMGAVYEKHSVRADGGYLMDHSSTVHLIDPAGRLRGVFAPPHVAAEVVEGFHRIKASAR